MMKAQKRPGKETISKSPTKRPEAKADDRMRAISIRQPYVEGILRGTKRFEYRSRPTKIRGVVYLYASMSPGPEEFWKKLKVSPGDLPTGVIVGTVEIVDCKYFEEDECYGYALKNPKRFEKALKAKNHPQPCWFFPF
ncbi:ASCH domain-containing protein [Bdellovibrionota bacterium FG-1]